MGRIGNSWRLFKQSYGVLMKDKELMLLPFFSMLCIGLVMASFVLGMGLLDGNVSDEDPVLYIGGFLFYVITYTIGLFFQGAVIAGASERMRGGDPTLGSALGAAAKRLPAFIIWGIIAATVGMIIRNIQERSEVVGKIVMGIVGAVWSLAIFFMVPVIVMESEGVGGSFKRSWALFKKTWGEMVVGNLGFGLLGFLLMLPAFGIAALIWMAGLHVVAVIVGILLVAAMSMFLSALQGVWVASLYRYATAGEVPDGFDKELFDLAFKPKN